MGWSGFLVRSVLYCRFDLMMIMLCIMLFVEKEIAQVLLETVVQVSIGGVVVVVVVVVVISAALFKVYYFKDIHVILNIYSIFFLTLRSSSAHQPGLIPLGIWAASCSLDGYMMQTY